MSVKCFTELIKEPGFTWKEEVNEKTGEKEFIVRGKGQQADVINDNNRLYSRKLWENVHKSERVGHDLKNRCLLGRLGHPEGSMINPADATHYTREIVLEEDGQVTVEHVLLPTPQGEIAKTLFRSGVKLGHSSRGDGEANVDKDGTEILDETAYELYGWDFVTHPSVSGAYPTVISEQKEEGSYLIVEQLLSNIESRIQQENVEEEELKGYEEVLEHVGLNPTRTRVSEILGKITEKKSSLPKEPESKPKKERKILRRRIRKPDKHESGGRKAMKLKASELLEKYKSLKKRYTVAEQLLQTALDKGRILEDRMKTEQKKRKKAEVKLSKSERELRAAEQLLEVSVNNSQLSSTVESLIAGNERADLYRTVLSGARSGREAERMFESLERKLNPDFKETKKTKNRIKKNESSNDDPNHDEPGSEVPMSEMAAAVKSIIERRGLKLGGTIND